MNAEEALLFADEWSRGLTMYEGAQGWRVVCMVLAKEVRRHHGLAAAIRQTLEENGHLADGDVCTLNVIKDAIEKVEN